MQDSASEGDITTTAGTGSENDRGTAGAVVGVASIVRAVVGAASMMRVAVAAAAGTTAAKPSSGLAAEAEAALCYNKIA